MRTRAQPRHSLLLLALLLLALLLLALHLLALHLLALLMLALLMLALLTALGVAAALGNAPAGASMQKRTQSTTA